MVLSCLQAKKQVRYVHALIEKTQERKLDDEKLFEKRLVRELKEEEKELGGASEKFVTAAYRWESACVSIRVFLFRRLPNCMLHIWILVQLCMCAFVHFCMCVCMCVCVCV